MSKTLNKEKKEILKYFEGGELVSVPGKKNYQEIAKYTLKKINGLTFVFLKET